MPSIMQTIPLPEESMSSVLVYLYMKELLEWRTVASSTKSMWVSPSHASHVTRRLCRDLHYARDMLKKAALLAPSPWLDGRQPIAHRDLPASKWKKCLNIGHKGAHGHVPGNTMASYIKAVELGVDVIEFDVLTTLDGVVVCHHDPVLQETGEWIENITHKKLRQELSHVLCTFEEMLQEKALVESQVHLYVDMKHTHIVRPTMYLLKHAVERWGWTADRFIVASFLQLELVEVNSFRKAIPELSSIRTACIIDGIPFTLGEQFEALEISALSVGKNNVTNDLVADCQRRGIQLWTWTVNNKTYMERLLKMGVDGICSDYPEIVREAADKFRPQSKPLQDGEASSALTLSAENSSLPVAATLPGVCRPEFGVLRAEGSAHESVPIPTGDRGGERYPRALDGWYSRRRNSPPASKLCCEQHLLNVVYGDLGGLREFSVGVVQEANAVLRASSETSAVKEIIGKGGGGEWSIAMAEMCGMAELCAEVASLVDKVLGPVMASENALNAAVELLSDEKWTSFRAELRLSIERDEPQPLLKIEKTFLKNVLQKVTCS